MRLRKQVSLDRETQKTLTESLAVSNAEAELFRRKYSELQLRMEALGVEAVEQRSSQARTAPSESGERPATYEQGEEQYRDQLLKLAETMLRFVKSTQSADPEARMEVEAQLRATNVLLAALGWGLAERGSRAGSDGRPGDQCQGRVVAGRWQPR